MPSANLSWLIAYVVLASDEHQTLLKYLETAKRETNNLAVERNHIMHGDYEYRIEIDDPNIMALTLAKGGKKTKWENFFADKDLNAEIPPLLDDIQKLTKQLMQALRHLVWTYLPQNRRPNIPAIMPDDLRQVLFSAHPELEPVTKALIWTPIRPTARTQT